MLARQPLRARAYVRPHRHAIAVHVHHGCRGGSPLRCVTLCLLLLLSPRLGRRGLLLVIDRLDELLLRRRAEPKRSAGPRCHSQATEARVQRGRRRNRQTDTEKERHTHRGGGRGEADLCWLGPHTLSKKISRSLSLSVARSRAFSSFAAAKRSAAIALPPSLPLSLSLCVCGSLSLCLSCCVCVCLSSSRPSCAAERETSLSHALIK